VDYDYSKRSYLLPAGCKDLIDVLNLAQKFSATGRSFKVDFTDRGMEISAKLNGLRNWNLEITVENDVLRVAGNDPKNPFESVFCVPPGFNPARASGAFSHGELRIIVPKI
jgi:HSP20 family molecular chaperone IbpA